MRATQRSSRLREIPRIARTMPRNVPMMPEDRARIRVFRSPTARSSGRTAAIASQSKKVCESWSRAFMQGPLLYFHGFAAGLPVGGHLAVRVPLLGEFGPRAVLDHGVEPGVERVDQGLVLAVDRVGREVLGVDDGLGDGGVIALLHLARGLLRRRDPR